MTKSQKNKNKITSKEKSPGKDKKSKKQFSIVRLVVFLTICIITVAVCLGFKTQIESLLNQDENLSASDIDKNGLTTHFVDQTTPNMIQRISEIFERKPLISKEI